MKVKVLLVENNLVVCDEMARFLENEGYEVIVSYDGVDAFRKFIFNSVDLILLNLRLPKKQGMSVLKDIRKRSSVPVIITSTLNNSIIKNKCIEAGADDFLVKPCCDKILLKRMNIELNSKKSIDEKSVWVYNDIIVDLNKNEIYKNGKWIELNGKPMKILKFLIRNEGRIVTRENIIDNVYYDRPDIMNSTINSHIWRLRGVVGKDSIECISGYGYKLNRLKY